VGDHQHDCPTCNGYTICYTKDCYAPNEEMAPCHDCLRKDLTAALAQLAEKEGPLCAAREQLKVACKWLAGSDWGTIDFERAMHEINAVGYAPCRHEEEAKRLEDALVNLMKSSDVTWYTGKHAGHDWREAVDAAHLTLVKYGRRAGGKG